MEETEFLRDGPTLVTNTRIELEGQTFAVRNIGSVKVTKPARPFLGGLICAVGIVVMVDEQTRGVGVLIAIAAAVWIRQQIKTRRLVFISGGGEVVGLKSTDGERVERIRAAISQAIAAR